MEKMHIGLAILAIVIVLVVLMVVYYYATRLTSAPSDGDYYIFKGMDPYGGGLSNLPGASLEQLKAACDADSRCVGFNTAKWLKSSMGNTKGKDWEKGKAFDFYAKSSAVKDNNVPY